MLIIILWWYPGPDHICLARDIMGQKTAEQGWAVWGIVSADAAIWARLELCCMRAHEAGCCPNHMHTVLMSATPPVWAEQLAAALWEHLPRTCPRLALLC